MASITSWTRLEPVPRRTDMTSGLRAELADPLWLLTRQWQFGEFAGEDAGSPVEAVVTVEAAPLTRVHAGQVATAPAARSIDVLDSATPLEPMIEARPVQGTVLDAHLAAEGGQHFLRLLDAHGAPAQRVLYVAEYPIEDGSNPGEHSIATLQWWDSVVGRVPDGRRLAADLLAHRGTAMTLNSLPDVPTVPAAQRSEVLRAANDFLRWWESLVQEPDPSADSWDPRRLEYSFAVQATLSDGQVVLRADDYKGGRLDWYEFEADTRTDLGPPDTALPETRQLKRRTMPAPAFYAGMPADRFWEFEDSSVRFGVASVGRTDLAHMLLNEFTLSYGNDWFVIPLTIPVGSLCAVRELRVVDSFGLETTVVRSAASGGWSMYDLSPRAGAAARAAGLFYLPSSVEVAQDGDPVEEVAWFRDEMANVVWAVERRTESPSGGAIDHYERAQQRLAAGGSQEPIGDVGEASLVYRLNSHVPENWFPLVPVRPPGAPAGVVQLELRPIRRVSAAGASQDATPLGRVLTASDPLVIEEEEVGREGVNAQVHWELTRDHRGHYHLWLAHRVAVGRGEGSSGLVFDVARPV